MSDIKASGVGTTSPISFVVPSTVPSVGSSNAAKEVASTTPAFNPPPVSLEDSKNLSQRTSEAPKAAAAASMSPSADLTQNCYNLADRYEQVGSKCDAALALIQARLAKFDTTASRPAVIVEKRSLESDSETEETKPAAKKSATEKTEEKDMAPAKATQESKDSAISAMVNNLFASLSHLFGRSGSSAASGAGVAEIEAAPQQMQQMTEILKSMPNTHSKKN